MRDIRVTKIQIELLKYQNNALIFAKVLHHYAEDRVSQQDT